jgi:hypothetical protein
MSRVWGFTDAPLSPTVAAMNVEKRPVSPDRELVPDTWQRAGPWQGVMRASLRSTIFSEGRVLLPPGARTLGRDLAVGAVGAGWLELTDRTDLASRLSVARVDRRGRLKLPPHGISKRFAALTGDELVADVCMDAAGHRYVAIASAVIVHEALAASARRPANAVTADGWCSPWS